MPSGPVTNEAQNEADFPIFVSQSIDEMFVMANEKNLIEKNFHIQWTAHYFKVDTTLDESSRASRFFFI